jgi:hypothetical protein
MTTNELVHGINLMGGYIDVYKSHWDLVRSAEERGLVRIANHRSDNRFVRVSLRTQFREKIHDQGKNRFQLPVSGW